MVRWMCNVSLTERMGIELESEVVKRNRLRWLGHALRKDDSDWVKKSMSYEVEGEREGKAEDDVKSCSREGHERAWFKKGGCAGA